MFPTGYTHKNALPKRSVRSRTISDYSPFGVLLPERSVNAGDFRYGFQGQERDDEVKGEGNSVNFKYRMHDPRVVRFFAVDPLAAKYPYNGSYNFSENRVIDGVELEGKEVDLNVLNPFSYLEQEFNKVNNELVSYPSNSLAVSSLTYYAESILPNVAQLNEDEKQQIFLEDALKTEAILVYEFASGTGEKTRGFDVQKHPFAKEIVDGYILKDIQDLLTGLKFEDVIENAPLRGSISFSPNSDPNSWGSSFSRHLESNSAQFFIGGAIFEINPSGIPGTVDVTISNTTSRNSLLFHVGDNYVDGELENKYQNITFQLLDMSFDKRNSQIENENNGNLENDK
jgi:RHS repeat-associated protein